MPALTGKVASAHVAPQLCHPSACSPAAICVLYRSVGHASISTTQVYTRLDFQAPGAGI